MNFGKKPSKSRQTGVAAIEMAIILPLFFTFMVMIVFFGRYLMAYTVVQKSAQAAARYMATVKVEEMKSRDLATAASNVSTGIARTMLADLHMNDSEIIEVECDTVVCRGGEKLPDKVRVTVRFWMSDDIFFVVGTGDYGLEVSAQVTMKYAGY